MTGTAAEVTPRALGRRPRDRRRPGHARAPEGVPRHRARQERPLGRTGSTASRSRRAPRREQPATRPIPLSSPWLDERDEELVLEVLRSGPALARPDGSTASRSSSPRRSARRTRPPSRAARPACISALPHRRRRAGRRGDHVAVLVRRLGQLLIYEGATPVFADVDPRTLNLDPAAVEAAITPRTKAIVAVDIFGYPCELDELRAICDRHGLVLIEDACEALGAEYKGSAGRLARPSTRSSPSIRTSR